jgi:transposase
MWTSKNRARYDRSKLRYPSDLTDDEWGLVEPLIPPGKTGGEAYGDHAGSGERPDVHSLDGLSVARDPKNLPPEKLGLRLLRSVDV